MKRIKLTQEIEKITSKWYFTKNDGIDAMVRFGCKKR